MHAVHVCVRHQVRIHPKRYRKYNPLPFILQLACLRLKFCFGGRKLLLHTPQPLVILLKAHRT